MKSALFLQSGRGENALFSAVRANIPGFTPWVKVSVITNGQR